MLHTGYVAIKKNGHANPTKMFERCKKYNDWTPLVTPQIAKKIGAQILSSFLHAPVKRPD